MKYLLTLSLVLVFLVACSQSDETEIEVITQGTLEIDNGWVRPGSAGMMTAAYFIIKNGTTSADTLKSIQSNVTDDTQIHESFEKEDGMMGMREVGMVPVNAESTAELKPGGIHIMIIRPNVDVALGDTVDFTLQFANYGEMELRLPVQSSSN